MSNPPPQAPRPLRLGRLLLFALATVGAILWAANAAVEWLESKGAVETSLPTDAVVYVEEQLFERVSDQWRTTEYALETMVPTVVPADKGDAIRVVVTGGSFAQGSPYSTAGDEGDRPGSISYWLKRLLEERLPGRRVDVINAAAAGQNSDRVRQVVAEALKLEPDVVVVASCNNEQGPRVQTVAEYLHRFGGYRLLNKLVRGDGASTERPLYLEVAGFDDDVSDAFEDNLASMAERSEKAGARFYLATLPVNLRFAGWEYGQPTTRAAADWSLLDSELAECLEEAESAMRAGEPRVALQEVQVCSQHPVARGLVNEIAVAAWRDGLTDDQTDGGDPCVRSVLGHYLAAEYETAIEAAKACPDEGRVYRWVGLSLLELDRFDEARATLNQAVELASVGQCRPTFNARIRKVAAERSGVALVDLQRLAERVSPDGIPGVELFVSNCHFRWSGYRLAALEIVRQMESDGLVPEATPRPVTEEEVKLQNGTPADPWADSLWDAWVRAHGARD